MVGEGDSVMCSFIFDRGWRRLKGYSVQGHGGEGLHDEVNVSRINLIPILIHIFHFV